MISPSFVSEVTCAVAYEEAIESLRSCCCSWGLKASGRRLGHHQVWARDSMIALLGARFVDDERIRTALRASIDLLRGKQSATGCIPNNVDADTLRTNFRAYADGGLWWIVGSALLDPDPRAIASVLRWYESQDVDQSGLLSMQEGADWQDLFCTRGKGLYLNCLYVLALRAAAGVDPANATAYLDRAADVAAKLNECFWYRGDGDMLPHIAHCFSTQNVQHYDSLGRKRWLPTKRYLVTEQYYLPYLGFRAAGEWFDCLGNLLAILAGIADEFRTSIILDFIDRHTADESLLPAIIPTIQPGDPDWRDYYGALNLPHHYHNGGIWPFIGGFHVAALVKAGRHDRAVEALAALAELNRQGEFNEWHHGETAEPMGVKDQAWSAGMYLFAYECVRTGTPSMLPGAAGAQTR